MNWSIHHVNLEAKDVRKTAAFYATILGMDEKDWVFPAARGYIPGDPDKLALMADNRSSHTGLHLIAPDPDFATKNDLQHNPSQGGHVAFEVDDLNAVKDRLSQAGIPFSDAGTFAIPGYSHIYVNDPAGNLLEINGKTGDADSITACRHMVLCKVRLGSEDDFDAICMALNALRDRLTMGPMSWGPNTSPEGLGRGHTHAFSMDFPTEADRDAYLNHPDHKALGAKLVALCTDGLDGLTVFDLEST